MLLKWFKADAMAHADGNIYYRGDYPSQRLIDHERAHLEQMKKLGKVPYFLTWGAQFLAAGGDPTKMDLEKDAWKK